MDILKKIKYIKEKRISNLERNIINRINYLDIKYHVKYPNSVFYCKNGFIFFEILIDHNVIIHSIISGQSIWKWSEFEFDYNYFEVQDLLRSASKHILEYNFSHKLDTYGRFDIWQKIKNELK